MRLDGKRELILTRQQAQALVTALLTALDTQELNYYGVEVDA